MRSLFLFASVLALVPHASAAAYALTLAPSYTFVRAGVGNDVFGVSGSLRTNAAVGGATFLYTPIAVPNSPILKSTVVADDHLIAHLAAGSTTAQLFSLLLPANVRPGSYTSTVQFKYGKNVSNVAAFNFTVLAAPIRSVAPVPEPRSAVALGMGALFLLRRGRPAASR